MTKLILTRHGQSVWNAENRFTGWKDVELTDLGIAQATEASKILYGAGQLARRLGLPFRSGGALCGSKLTDAQSAYESANTLQAALYGGVNFMLHACGWLEGGLVSSFEKFVIDADQLDTSIEEELKDFIKIKKDSMPDSFV